MVSVPDKDTPPPIHGDPLPSDFFDLLAFNFDEARIWLGDRRMMMIDVSLFAGLRQRLIEALGMEEARILFMRLGFEAGLNDARLLLKRWPEAPSQPEKFSIVSPHRFQGITKLEILRADRDPRGGLKRGEFRWKHSVEADAHLNSFGRSSVPVCWMEQGYGTGYALGMYGHLNAYEEIGCRAMGNADCTIIGIRMEDYEHADEYLERFEFLRPYANTRSRANGKARTQAATVTARVADTRGSAAPDTIVGKSPGLSVTRQLLESVAPSNATVLFTGESGVGKELFTRNLHRLSNRADKPFIAVSCAAIPETLIEAELFGVERGAFTGATESRPGRFERANGGTLFLDEIGSLNMAAQVKLLRVIQEREIERIGGTSSTRLDVRLVAANNVPLRELVDRGEFREDLFYRLNVFPIHVPPLRERRDDIPDLMAHFLSRYNEEHGRNISGFTFNATRALLNYHYPGNIRELQNLIERAVILAQGKEIDVSNLFAYGESLGSNLWGVDATGKISSRKMKLQDRDPVNDLLAELSDDSDRISWPGIEERLFASLARKVLCDVDGNISAAARRLGMKRHQFEYRVKQLKILE